VASRLRRTISPATTPPCRYAAVQILRADYCGFLHERPSLTVSIFELALDNTWLGFTADIADYSVVMKSIRLLVKWRVTPTTKDSESRPDTINSSAPLRIKPVGILTAPKVRLRDIFCGHRCNQVIQLHT
jgi:hypothetical protein